jgi:hypothetical protein
MFSDAPHISRNTFSVAFLAASSGMLPILKVLASAFALLLPNAAPRTNAADAPLRILWIGNSYTYVNDLPRIIAELADSSKVQRPPAITGILKGGELLKGHWANPALQKALLEKWDVVVMQEQSTTPITAPDTLVKYGKLIADAAHRSGARIVLYVPWSQKARPAAEDTIVAAYRVLGNEVHAQLALAGRAWMDVIAQDPGVELYQKDGSHPLPQGSYIAACVFYEVLFGKSPVGLPAIGVTPAEARRAQEAAHRVLAAGK